MIYSVCKLPVYNIQIFPLFIPEIIKEIYNRVRSLCVMIMKSDSIIHFQMKYKAHSNMTSRGMVINASLDVLGNNHIRIWSL